MNNNNVNKVVKSAITGVLALAAMGTMVLSTVAQAAEDMEKCYGIAKMGKNDCKTMTYSCAGTVMQDRPSDAFIVVPHGVCDKIAGGTLEPATKSNTSQTNNTPE